MVEAYMRSLKSTLRLCVQTFRRDWDIVLPAAALAYRSTPHSVTRHSPFFLVTGQEVVLPLSRTWNEPVLCRPGATWLHALWRCRLQVLKDHARMAAENKKAATPFRLRLRPGMHVAVRLTAKEQQEKGKFTPYYKGPYIVKSVRPCGLTAELHDPVTGSELVANRYRLKFLDAPPSVFIQSRALPRTLFA